VVLAQAAGLVGLPVILLHLICFCRDGLKRFKPRFKSPMAKTCRCRDTASTLRLMMRFRFCVTDPPRQTLRSDSNEMMVLFRSYSQSLVCDDQQFPWKCHRYNIGFKAKFYTSNCALFVWPPCVALAEADIVSLPCGFLFFFLFSFPRPLSAVGEWMSTILPHMV